MDSTAMVITDTYRLLSDTSGADNIISLFLDIKSGPTLIFNAYISALSTCAAIHFGFVRLLIALIAHRSAFLRFLPTSREYTESSNQDVILFIQSQCNVFLDSNPTFTSYIHQRLILDMRAHASNWVYNPDTYSDVIHSVRRTLVSTIFLFYEAWFDASSPWVSYIELRSINAPKRFLDMRSKLQGQLLSVAPQVIQLCNEYDLKDLAKSIDSWTTNATDVPSNGTTPSPSPAPSTNNNTDTLTQSAVTDAPAPTTNTTVTDATLPTSEADEAKLPDTTLSVSEDVTPPVSETPHLRKTRSTTHSDFLKSHHPYTESERNATTSRVSHIPTIAPRGNYTMAANATQPDYLFSLSTEH